MAKVLPDDTAPGMRATLRGRRSGGRSGGGLGRWGFGLQFGGLVCEHPQPYAKRGADDDSNSAPPAADNPTAQLQIYAEKDAGQVANGREAEEHAGDA